MEYQELSYIPLQYCAILGRVISAHISLVVIILCTAHARNNEIDWEGTGGRSLTARTGA